MPGPIKKDDLIEDEALKAPLELGDNFLKAAKDADVLIETLKKLSKIFSDPDAPTSKKTRESVDKLAQAEKRLGALYGESAQAIARVNTQAAQRRKELREEAKQVVEIVSAYDKQSNRLNILRKRYKNVAAEQGIASKEAKKLRVEVSKLDKELKDIDASAGQFQRNVANYPKGLKLASGAIGKLGLAGAVAGGAIALRNMTKEIIKNRQELVKLTNASGKAADKYTASISAAAKVFDKEFNEVLRTANTVSKEFGIGLDESIELINDGFIKGIDVNGEYLDSLREYSVFSKEVGLEAQELNDILQLQVKEGIFSDKGIDAVKEAGIRLRELTPITAAALDGIGLSSKEIEKSLKDGSKSIIDVVKEVSTQLKTLPPQSKEVGAAIADIFGGAGEDAGLRFITLLDDVGSGLDSANEETKKYEKTQRDLLESQELLNEKLVAFGNSWEGVGSKLSTFLNKAGAGALDFLTGIIDGFDDFSDSLTRFEKSLKGATLKQLEDELKALETQGQFTIKNFGRALVGMNALAEGAAKDAVKIAILKQAILDLKFDLAGATDEEEDLGEASKKTTGALDKQAKVTRGKRKDTDLLKVSVDKLKKSEDELYASAVKSAEALNTIQKGITEGQTAGEEAIERLNNAILNQVKLAVETSETKKGISAEEFELITQGMQQTHDVFNGFVQLRQEQLQQEFEANETRRQTALQNAQDDEREKFQINAEFDRKQEEIKKKQLQAQKAASLFQIGINTAVAISQGIAQFGPPPSPAGIAAIIAATALGVAQTAAVLSQKVPEFDKGTDSTPEGLYWAGEKAPEIGIKNGKARLIDKPTLFNNMPGMEIISSDRTKEILGNNSDMRFLLDAPKQDVQQINDNRELNELREMNGILRKIANKEPERANNDFSELAKTMRREDKYPSW